MTGNPWRVPLTEATLGEAEAEAAARVIRSRWVTQGAEIAAFEKEFAAAIGSQHAIAVANGTAALHLAYEVAALGPDEEFILPALTFAATMNAGLYQRARPILADITSENDLTISLEDVRRKITHRTRLIVTVPYGGYAPDMVGFRNLAEEAGVALVEDACHAPLATRDGIAVGTAGLASTWSFYGNKNLTTGEGGMVLTDDAAIADRLRRLRTHGMTTPTWQRHFGDAPQYDVAELGYNYRMDEVRAAIGRVQLGRLEGDTVRREQAAKKLRAALAPLASEGLTIPFAGHPGRSAHHLFVALLPPGSSRERFRRSLREQGVQTSLHYPPLDEFSHYREYFAREGGNDTPIFRSIAGRLVTLPLSPWLTDEQIAIVAEACRLGLEHAR